MATSPTVEGTSNVSVRIFEEFLQALEDTGVSAELVARLRKTLLEEQAFTDGALKAAVLDEEPLP